MQNIVLKPLNDIVCLLSCHHPHCIGLLLCYGTSLVKYFLGDIFKQYRWVSCLRVAPLRSNDFEHIGEHWMLLTKCTRGNFIFTCAPKKLILIPVISNGPHNIDFPSKFVISQALAGKILMNWNSTKRTISVSRCLSFARNVDYPNACTET